MDTKDNPHPHSDRWIKKGADTRGQASLGRFASPGLLLSTTFSWVILCLASSARCQEKVLIDTNGPREFIEVYVGHSKVLEAPWLLKRVAISQPDFADVEILSPQQILLVAKAAGSTTVIMWGEDDEMWQTRVNVLIDLQLLQDELSILFPTASLEIRDSALSPGVHVITGVFENTDQVEALHRLMDAKEIGYVDMTRLAGLQQVQIEVRMAEVNRAAFRALGINWFHTGNNFFGASTVGGPSGPINIGVPTAEGGEEGAVGIVGALVDDLPFQFLSSAGPSSAVTLLAGLPRADMQFFIQALAENQYLQILAEPTLVALSGEQASFLAGGEFPIPIVQSGTGGGGSSISIEYKRFGVQLDFLPLVLGDGVIRLRVLSEVSQLSDIGAVQIEGFSVPSLLTRRAETTLQLKDGESFAMAGLLNRSDTAITSRVPILGDLPLIGKLFRSVRHNRMETELLLMVTATLVNPLSESSDRLMPGAGYLPPNDKEFFLHGWIEGREVEKGTSKAVDGLSGLGLDQLISPSAWAVSPTAETRDISSTNSDSMRDPSLVQSNPQTFPLEQIGATQNEKDNGVR